MAGESRSNSKNNSSKPKNNVLSIFVPIIGILILVGAIGFLGYLIYKKAGSLTKSSETPTAWQTERSATESAETEASPSAEEAAFPSAPEESSPSAQLSYDQFESTVSATIVTDKGDITFRLFPSIAPDTVTNFIEKAESGFYEGLIFHRVEDWVIQGGDPIGTGGGGGEMPTEFSEVPFKEGSVGVARGPVKEVSNDSQFFICTADCSWLTGDYTLFGEVTEGMDVAKSIEPNDMIVKTEIIYEES